MKDIDDAVAELQRKYIAAVSGRNVEALMQLYDPKLRVFDAWGVWQYGGRDAWRVAAEGWLSSDPSERFRVEFKETEVSGNADLALATAIVTYAADAPDGKELRAMQNRITWAVKTSGHNLKIVHEHTSAPIGFEDMKAILQRSA